MVKMKNCFHYTQRQRRQKEDGKVEKSWLAKPSLTTGAEIGQLKGLLGVSARARPASFSRATVLNPTGGHR